ncbi:MAG TPA: DUF4097 family beta strand repeat-containing protein [Allosphingosinicella sp.]|jgi:hypothetical protein
MARIWSKAALAIAIAAPLLGNVQGSTATQDDHSTLTAREEIHDRYELGAAPTVTVRGIAGPVSVETVAGNVAEVHIVRRAATERELQCYRTEITRKASGLAIEHVQFSDRPGCSTIRSRQTVRLKLPRSANVQLSVIGGRVDIDGVAGSVRLESIAGRVNLTGVRAAQLSSLAGGLSLALAQGGTRTIQVSSVVGPVDIKFPRGANADVQISSVQGSVRSDWRELSGSDGLAYRIGSGGADVSISSVIGPVRLSRF